MDLASTLKSIALDLQKQVVRLVANGMSKVKVAKELKIGEATVYRILRSMANTQKSVESE